MKKLVIEGKNKLSGTINISGAKNSVVALIPAAMLTDEKCILNNVPDISDVRLLIKIMKELGSEIEFDNNRLIIDNSKCHNKKIKQDYASKMRASYYFMGVLLSKYGKAELSYPGGCSIGTRPINFHIEGFKKLGAEVVINDDTEYVITAEKLVGCDIFLEFASVGATINLMYAAVKAEGITNIYNAAKEPEIVNIANFLNKMGAKVSGAGTDKISIEGVSELKGAEIDVIPDRIEAGTYIMIGALLGQDLKIQGIIPEHLQALISKLKEAGANVELFDDYVITNYSNNLRPLNVKTLVYPGFVTDLGQPMSTLLTQCNGDSVFEETIYENRMKHIKFLQAMGANIDLTGNIAVVHGKNNLKGTDVEATDLRAGAAMLIAGMIAEGTTTISNIEHLLRGYENIVEKLTNVGAKIKIINE